MNAAAGQIASILAAAATSADLPHWSCPAHRQIVRSRPGTCPICGAKLVPVEVGCAHPGTLG